MSKILIVDDETFMRGYLYDALQADGREVITVPSGAQMFSRLASDKPELVILDIQMPGENGLSLLRRVKQSDFKDVLVVIFSGRIDQKVEKEAYEAGAIQVLKKDIGYEDLRQKIDKILSNKDRFKKTPEEVMAGEKLLVVDDEEMVRDYLEGYLQAGAFETITARDGKEAIALVKEERPKVMLLDVMMPGMDGVLTLRRVREVNQDVGVIMATATIDEEVVKECRNLGAYGYVIKPFDLQYLEMVVLTRMLIAA